MKQFQLIEERGNDIYYTLFVGSLKDCMDKKESMVCAQHDSVGYPEEYYNGNGQPFTYKVIPA